MRATALILAAAVALPTQADAATSDRSRPLRQPIERGFEVARRHCAACHAVGPSGASPAPLAPAFRDLHKDYPVSDLIGAIAEGAPTGHPMMPRFSLGFADRQALIAYVRSLDR